MSYLFHQIEYYITDLEDNGFDCKISKLYACQNAVNVIENEAQGIFLPENQTFYFNAHIRIDDFTGAVNELENFELNASNNNDFWLKGYNISIHKNVVKTDEFERQINNIESRICQMINNINNSRQVIGAIYFRTPEIEPSKIPYNLFIMFGLIVQNPIPMTSTK